MIDTLNTYDELNEDIQFTEDETKALLKLSEKAVSYTHLTLPTSDLV